MKPNPGMKFGDDIQVARHTQDGKIWLPGRIVWLGHVSFKAELSGSVTKQLFYSEQNETWKGLENG